MASPIGASRTNPDSAFRRAFSTALATVRLSRQTRQDLIKLVGGTGLGRLLLLISTPLVTRLYGLECFGVLGFFISIVSVASVCATAKYDFAIVSARTRAESMRLVLGGLGLAFALSLAWEMACIGLIASRGTLDFQGLPGGSLLLIGPAILLTAAFLLLREYHVRQAHLAGIAQAVLAQSTVKAITQVMLGLLGAAPLGLVISDTLSRGAAILPFARRFTGDLRDDGSRLSWGRVIATLRSNYRFPLYCLPSTLINTISLYAPAPLMIAFYGVDAGGALALTWSVLTLPINLIGRGVSDVFHRKVSHGVARGDGSARRLLRRTVLRLLMVGSIPAAILALYGEPILCFALGPDCALAGKMAEVMAPWMLAQLAVTPVTQAMSVTRSHHVKLIYDVASAVAVFASIPVVAGFSGSPVQAILALSTLNVAAYVLLYYLLRYAISRACPRENTKTRPATTSWSFTTPQKSAESRDSRGDGNLPRDGTRLNSPIT